MQRRRRDDRTDLYQDTGAIVKLVLDGLTSEHSRRAYEKALTNFLAWHAEQGRPPLSKALVCKMLYFRTFCSAPIYRCKPIDKPIYGGSKPRKLGIKCWIKAETQKPRKYSKMKKGDPPATG